MYAGSDEALEDRQSKHATDRNVGILSKDIHVLSVPGKHHAVLGQVPSATSIVSEHLLFIVQGAGIGSHWYHLQAEIAVFQDSEIIGGRLS